MIPSVETGTPRGTEPPAETGTPTETEPPAETQTPVETEPPAETEPPVETPPPAGTPAGTGEGQSPGDIGIPVFTPPAVSWIPEV